MELAVMLEGFNSILLISLLYVYLNNYKQLKNPFILGLIIFAALLFLHNILALYFHFIMVDFYSKEVMQHALLVSGAQTLALLVLNYVTWRE